MTCPSVAANQRAVSLLRLDRECPSRHRHELCRRTCGAIRAAGTAANLGFVRLRAPSAARPPSTSSPSCAGSRSSPGAGITRSEAAALVAELGNGCAARSAFDPELPSTPSQQRKSLRRFAIFRGSSRALPPDPHLPASSPAGLLQKTGSREPSPAAAPDAAARLGARVAWPLTPYSSHPDSITRTLIFGGASVYRVVSCLTTQHDYRLVLLAAFVCATAALASFKIYSHVVASHGLASIGLAPADGRL